MWNLFLIGGAFVFMGILFRFSKRRYLIEIHYIIIFLGFFILMAAIGKLLRM